MKKIEHDHKCERCGKVATINHQNEFNTYRITPNGEFEPLDTYEGDINEFWCDECFEESNN